MLAKDTESSAYIGFYLFKANGMLSFCGLTRIENLRLNANPAPDLVAKTTFGNGIEGNCKIFIKTHCSVSCAFDVPAGNYILLPCTYEPNHYLAFQITLFTVGDSISCKPLSQGLEAITSNDFSQSIQVRNPSLLLNSKGFMERKIEWWLSQFSFLEIQFPDSNDNQQTSESTN